jgi:uncharacterized protein YprB with RNaseH-like and TPR domain
MVTPDRERLRRAMGFRGRAGEPDSAGVHPARESLREFLKRRQRLQPRQPVELPAGVEEQNEHGAFWRREVRYSLDHRHGDVLLGAALEGSTEGWAEFCEREGLGEARLQDLLFVDTETTGLGGGAGTIVFNIGLAWFDEEAFVFEQLFLRDFGEEPAMLAQMQRRLVERPVLVSFVGKSFDRHRIAARLAVHRLDAAILTPRHLDLYHVARRRFGRELPNCRLKTVEEQRLGLRRADDLPGSEAPAAFLDWIRDRSGPVDRVLEHNRLDVLSLAALLGLLLRDRTVRED